MRVDNERSEAFFVGLDIISGVMLDVAELKDQRAVRRRLKRQGTTLNVSHCQLALSARLSLIDTNQPKTKWQMFDGLYPKPFGKCQNDVRSC